jgi:hypothetical protein
MLYVRYVHLKMAKHVHKKQIHPFVRGQYAYKDYDRKVQMEISLIMSPKRLAAKTN